MIIEITSYHGKIGDYHGFNEDSIFPWPLMLNINNLWGCNFEGSS